jgi:hypothetical protein
MVMYVVIVMPDEAGDILEQLGTKPKFWFSDENSNRYRFKLNRSDGDDVTRDGKACGFTSRLYSLIRARRTRTTKSL